MLNSSLESLLHWLLGVRPHWLLAVLLWLPLRQPLLCLLPLLCLICLQCPVTGGHTLLPGEVPSTQWSAVQHPGPLANAAQLSSRKGLGEEPMGLPA